MTNPPPVPGVSHTFDMPSGSARDSTDDTLWAMAPAQVHRLGDQHVLLRVRKTGRQSVLDAGAFQVLAACTAFRPLARHARERAAELGAQAGMEARVLGLLDNLRQQGLLVTARDVLDSLRGAGAAPGAAPPPLRKAVIRTCDRPGMLKRLLASVGREQARHQSAYEYLVIDDSRDPASLDENLAVIGDAGSTHELRIRYHGPDQQQALTERLVSAHAGAEKTIRWLLQPGDRGAVPTPGRALNHALLLTAGERFVLLDDDMLLEPRMMHPPAAGFALGTPGQACRFFADRDELQVQSAPVPVDLFARHADVLGGSLGALLDGYPEDAHDPSALASLNLSEAPRLAAGNPVLLSLSSVFGDPGTSGVHWIYELDEHQGYARLVRSEQQYRAGVEGCHVWRGHDRTTFLTDVSLMLTGCAGISNTVPLAPACPEDRNEDLVFGEAVQFLYPGTVTSMLPWGPLHFPEPARRRAMAALDRPVRPGMPGLLASLMRAMRPHCPAQHADRRAAFVADSLRAMADAPPAVLGDHVVNQVLADRSGLVGCLRRHITARPGAPTFWRADAQRIIDANMRPIDPVREPWQSLVGLPGDADPSGVEAAVRSVFTGYADALELWPELWAKCREEGAGQG